jgi:hypothetical protein
VDSCSLAGWFDSVLSSGSFVICMIPTIGPDPLHFDTDTDPNPWIRTLDYRSGSWFCSFWQLLSSIQQKMSFLSSFLLSFHSWFLFTFLLVDRRIWIRICTNNYGSGSKSNLILVWILCKQFDLNKALSKVPLLMYQQNKDPDPKYKVGEL